MVNSINTNYGAMVALQSFNRTNRELETVQKRVSTGFRVADAKDDGAAFAVAQGLRADIKGNEAAGERLASAKGLLAVTQTALTGISDTLGKLHGAIVKMYDVTLKDRTLSSQEYKQYASDYDALREEIRGYVNQANYGGINLLNGSHATGVNTIAGADGSTINLGLNASAFFPQTDIVDKMDGSIWESIDEFDDPYNVQWWYSDIQQWLFPTGLGNTNFDDFRTLINSHIATIGQNIRSVENQDNFLKIKNDALTNAMGSIIDADLAKESAKLQALQIRQQLGTQTLSIANQAPSILLSLFR